MDKINAEDFTLRILQASPAQLVVINYELLMTFLKWADAIPDPSAEKENFSHAVGKARDGVMQLIAGLNLELTLAQDLYQIYSYVYERLTKAFFRYDRAPVTEALELMGMLMDGFQKAAEQDTTETSPGAPQVFSGLTYERNGLSEYIDQDDRRGFKA